MLLRMHKDQTGDGRPATPAGLPGSLWRGAAVACVLVCMALAATHELTSQDMSRPILSPAANRPPDANDQMAMHEQQSKKGNVEAANVERKRQIGEDSARLLKLATDLKVEVDKTSKDTLSLGVIRKADEIERLAHSVKEKMKLTMSASN
jgi:hypothetical protein